MNAAKLNAIQCPNSGETTAERLLRLMPEEEAIRVQGEAEAMARFALTVKDEERASYCILPFDHSAEGEALGGNVWKEAQRRNAEKKALGRNSEKEALGRYSGMAAEAARKSNLTLYTNADDLAKLSPIDLQAGRISEILHACRSLAQRGETVLLNVSGPMTALNVLMDSLDVVRIIMEGMAGSEKVRTALSFLRDNLVELAGAAGRAGVSAISYADAMGAEDICGPELSEWLSREFTAPFLSAAAQRLGAGKLLLLCPKTAYSLVNMGLADWEEPISAVEPMPYIDACLQAEASNRAAALKRAAILNQAATLNQPWAHEVHQSAGIVGQQYKSAGIVGQQCLSVNGSVTDVRFLRVSGTKG